MILCSKNQSNSLKGEPFYIHFNFDLEKVCVTSLQEENSLKVVWKNLGNLLISYPKFCQNGISKDLNHIYNRITKHLKTIVSSKFITKQILNNISYPFSPFQTEVISVLNNYLDFFYPFQSLDQVEQLRYIYTVHVLNHIFKSKNLINTNNTRLKKNEKLINSCRDRGLTRPKVLLLIPFRSSAFSTVNTLIHLIYGSESEMCKKNGIVINYDRFNNEYTGNELKMSKSNPKPKDYEYIFGGNIDDNFQIGISFKQQHMILFSDFSSSDMLIASPLGLRLVTKSKSVEKTSYDFLNSIELLIIDQAEMLYAQNWDNVLYILKHMHLKPNSTPNIDINRVRLWNLNGLSKYYRQTILLSAHDIPELRNIFNTHFNNYFGKVRIAKPLQFGTINNIVLPISQVFHRVEVNDYKSVFEERFQYFINKILSRFQQRSLSHCMIYVPSYFDFVRLRNYLKSENINFAQICEYTKSHKIDRARDVFYHGRVNFLLYSERAHVFRRMRIKGIRHLIIYQPPYWPTYFSEIINLMKRSDKTSIDDFQNSLSITVIYTKYDFLQLKCILGSEKTSKLFKSENSLHVMNSE